MRTTRSGGWRLVWIALGLAALAAGGSASGAGAQEAGPDRRERVREWFAARYRISGDADRVGAEELDRLAALWIDATDPGAGPEARRDALRALVDAMIDAQGIPDRRYGESARSAMAARADEIVGLAVPPDPLPVETAPPWTLGSVEVRGSGPVPLVLLSDIDYDGTLYEEFARLHRDRFTMYAVTLPGAGGTRPPPLAPDSPPSGTAWWDAAAEGVLSLVEEEGLDRPAIAGVTSGAYLAARLAIDHPERFRAAILLHGLVRSFLVMPGSGTPATPEERRRWADATLPSLFPPPGPDSVLRSYRAAAGAAAIDSATADALARRAARTDPSVVSRYSTELLSTDLHDDFAGLRVPTLVIPSIHDESSPVGGTEFGVGQWQGLLLGHPEIPLSVVPFRATRNYAPVDSPVELGRAIEDFLAGREVRGKPRDPALTAYRTSARSGASRVLGATDVTIAYSSPPARGRAIWGGVVPWDGVWRAGANAATRITFSRDLEVEGRPLAAGAYSLFVIPRETDPWTVIFNRVDIQFGGFAYDSAHDALRLELEAGEAPPEERLTYRITPRGPVEGRVEMSWAGRRVGFRVLAAEGTGLTRVAALDPVRFRDLAWTTLATDTAGDGRIPSAPDGRALAYHHDPGSDTLWLRFELEAPPPGVPGVGVNVAVDTDRDPSTGSPWWGGNGGFRFDRVLTAWVIPGHDDSLWGTVGLSDDVSALAGDYTALGSDNLAVALDREGRAVVVGVEASALDDDGIMDLIGTVGTNVFWNDELVDEGSVELRLGGS